MNTGTISLILLLAVLRRTRAFDYNCKNQTISTISKLKTISTPPDDYLQLNAQFSCVCETPAANATLLGVSLYRTCVQSSQTQPRNDQPVCVYNATLGRADCANSGGKYALAFSKQSATSSIFSVTITNASALLDSGTYTCDCQFLLQRAASSGGGSFSSLGVASDWSNTTNTSNELDTIFDSTVRAISYVWLVIQSEPGLVQALKCENVTSRGFIIRWLPGSDGNAPVLAYLGRAKAVNCSGSTAAKMEGSFEVSNTSQQFVFADATTYCRYEVSVLARNAIGFGQSSRTSCFTLPDAPERPVCSVKSTNNSLSVTITPNKLNGQFASYDVELFEVTPSSAWSPTKGISPSASSPITVNNLQPFTEYMVRGYVYNVNYRSPPCELSVRTADGIPDAVQNLQVRFMDENALVTFEPPARKNGEIKYYVIEACPIPLSGESCTEVKPGEPKQKMTVTLILALCRAYKFTVTAYTVAGSGPSVVRNYTSPDYNLTDAERPKLVASFNASNLPSQYLAPPSSSFTGECKSPIVVISGRNEDPLRYLVTLSWDLTSSRVADFLDYLELRINRCTARPGESKLRILNSPTAELGCDTANVNFYSCDIFTRDVREVSLELRSEPETARFYTFALTAIYRSACPSAYRLRRATQSLKLATAYVGIHVPAAPGQPADNLVIYIVPVICAIVVVSIAIGLAVWIVEKRRASRAAAYQAISNGQPPVKSEPQTTVEGTPRGRFEPLLDSYDPLSENHLCKEDFVRRVAHFHADSNALFAGEYREINLISQQLMARGHLPAQCSLDPANMAKNRYSGILAFDRTRVKLRGPPLPRNGAHRSPADFPAGSAQPEPADRNASDNARSDYINANYVDSYEQRGGYIATQGPLRSTFADFWAMVFQEGSNTIVMLTNLVEGRKPKCDKYWPDECEQYGAYEVQFLNKQQRANYTVREFALRERRPGASGDASGSESDGPALVERIVRQFHFTNWPDDSTPHFALPVLEFVRKSSLHSTGPIIVHCSAGVGRTGTYICIHSMIQQFERTQSLNVRGFLMHIRKQRNFLVHTEEQYVFVHDALLEYVECGGPTEKSASQLSEYAQFVRQPQDGESELARQFELVTRYRPHAYDCMAASKGCNSAKNRQVTLVRVDDNGINVTQTVAQPVVPLDLNRAKLAVIPGQEGSDYFNASIVQGFQFDNEFIIAQAPFSEQTELDFWRAVWEFNTQLIVLFDDPNTPTPDAHICNKYWPLTAARWRAAAPNQEPEALPNGLCVSRYLSEYRFGDQLTVIQFVINRRNDDYVLQTRVIIVHERWPDAHRMPEGEVSSAVFGLVLMAQYINSMPFQLSSNDYGTLGSAMGTWSNTIRTEIGSGTLSSPTGKFGPFSFGMNTLPAGVLQTDIDAVPTSDGHAPSNRGLPRLFTQLSRISVPTGTMRATGARADESRSPIVVVDRHGARQCALFSSLANLFAQFTDDNAFDVYSTAKLLHLQRPFVFESASDLDLLYAACVGLVRDGPPPLSAIERSGLFLSTPPTSPSTFPSDPLGNPSSTAVVDLPPAFIDPKLQTQSDVLQPVANGGIAKRHSAAIAADKQAHSNGHPQHGRPALIIGPNAASPATRLSAHATNSASRIEPQAQPTGPRPMGATKASSEPPSDDIIITPPRTSVVTNSPTKLQPNEPADKLRAIPKAASTHSSLNNQLETNVDEAEDEYDNSDARRPLLRKGVSENADAERALDAVRESSSKNSLRTRLSAEIELADVRGDNPRV